MGFDKNKILVLGRIKATNYGDVVIADCCAYMLNKLLEEKRTGLLGLIKPARVGLANVNKTDEKNIRSNISDYNKIVFPGGGINSLKVTNALLKRLDTGAEVRYYFNGIGIHPERHHKQLSDNIERLLNDPRVRQVTTRGDLAMTREYITSDKPYPIEWIIDPAIWSDEAYGISKDESSDIIGIGPIRPEIFNEQDSDVSLDDVYLMYENLLKEVESRGMRWKLFCNGTEPDFTFSKEILDRFGYSEEEHLIRKPGNAKELVKDISRFKGVIAARFHANIISTSLRIPSVALVWNVKMRGFSELIGCRDRYVEGMDRLSDAGYLVDALCRAMEEGYDEEKINREKQRARATLLNIISD